jgi:hypothetical protein
MAIENIQEYIEVAAGDLIRAEHWNEMQRLARNSIRTHRHTGQSADTADDEDNAPQITSEEIADGAITTPKLGEGAATTTKIANSAISNAKLQAGSVDLSKLALTTVKNGSVEALAAGSTREELVEALSIQSSSGALYFPTIDVTATSSGFASVEPTIVYRQVFGATTTNGFQDVFIRLVNQGTATARVGWTVKVLA